MLVILHKPLSMVAVRRQRANYKQTVALAKQGADVDHEHFRDMCGVRPSILHHHDLLIDCRKLAQELLVFLRDGIGGVNGESVEFLEPYLPFTTPDVVVEAAREAECLAVIMHSAAMTYHAVEEQEASVLERIHGQQRLHLGDDQQRADIAEKVRAMAELRDEIERLKASRRPSCRALLPPAWVGRRSRRWCSDVRTASSAASRRGSRRSGRRSTRACRKDLPTRTSSPSPRPSWRSPRPRPAS